MNLKKHITAVQSCHQFDIWLQTLPCHVRLSVRRAKIKNEKALSLCFGTTMFVVWLRSIFSAKVNRLK